MTELILGIETSCDETAAAVVADGRHVRSNVVHSQASLHERWRGVVPEVASRSHTQRILPIVEQALAEAGIQVGQLTAVAVTHRPGMVGCLLVGLAAGKTLCWLQDLPLVGVDHVQAHIHAAFLAEPDLQLPALALVASGGHTALWLLSAPSETTRLGTTRDDAAGEALDKGAAILGLPYPGGPSIQAAAVTGDAKSTDLPRALLGPDSLDFSFSGLKTALLYAVRGPGAVRPAPELSAQQVADLAAAYQEAVVDVLVAKLVRAARQFPVRSLCIGGGVARNARLRQRLGQERMLGSLRLVMPEPALCSDNGAMVAALGSLLLRQGHTSTFALDAVGTPQAGGKARRR
jgi:tRNA N6-adenosine threonylcarbamoyltransferase